MFHGMNKIRVLAGAFLLGLIVISMLTALAATNIVPVTRLFDASRPFTLSELAPLECASIRNSLEQIVDCSLQGSPCGGSGSVNELILGTSGNETIDGKSGDDCIVGGGGDDSLLGGNGNDVLIGGPGTDSLNGEGRPIDSDLCIDDAGSSSFVDCESIQ